MLLLFILTCQIYKNCQQLLGLIKSMKNQGYFLYYLACWAVFIISKHFYQNVTYFFVFFFLMAISNFFANFFLNNLVFFIIFNYKIFVKNYNFRQIPNQDAWFQQDGAILQYRVIVRLPKIYKIWKLQSEIKLPKYYLTGYKIFYDKLGYSQAARDL